MVVRSRESAAQTTTETAYDLLRYRGTACEMFQAGRPLVLESLTTACIGGWTS
jgi:hypothetical protein